jgi:SAM-dependent methyltransferase
MANFPPIKNYILYCLDRLIEQYGLVPPFLDVGCGNGDISQHVARKGWYGKAIDISDVAVEDARNNLALLEKVDIEKKSLFQETETFRTIFLMDVLEHIENDRAALEKVSSLLPVSGHVIIAVPSNPREWRWDDDFYGHHRRYTVEETREKLANAHLEPLVFWDFTYPIFWIMRRIYTKLKPLPRDVEEDKLLRTHMSSSVNAWDIPVLSYFLSRECVLWNFLYKMQFTYFKDKVNNGYEMVVLARKVV